jgi:hypothetical protein
VDSALLTVGPYVGELAPEYRAPELLARLAELPALLASPEARPVAGGRNRHVRIDLPLGGASEAVIVKAFGRQAWLRDLRDRRRGSKARRSWLAAAHLQRHGAGTPRAIGYLERWEGGRLRESYFLAAYQSGAVSLREALLTLFHELPEAASFIELLESVAAGVRGMHAAGFVHNDLGNQNVLLRPDGPGRWRDFQVIDLNRGRIRRELGVRERARDLSRLSLPSHLLRVFMKMYWQASPPRALARWERVYRWLYGLHSRSRAWRHPIREARRRAEGGREERRRYPAPRDMWIWDERTGQPIHAILRKERLAHYPAARYVGQILDTLRAAPGLWRSYGPLLEGAFRQPVNLAGRIGMALHPSPATLEHELSLLAGLGRIPAFVRFYHHEARAQRAFRVELVRALRAAGHPVAIALVQDRKAVRDPGAWSGFVEDVLGAVAPMVEAVEVGHNVNRAKWGIWDFRELRALYAPIEKWHARFPALQFMGPGAIDFEYLALLSVLRQWPAGVPLSALSHHLYVDRRGAPENPQGRFSALEKFALARAIARRSPACEDRLVVSEVNWPLKGTGVYSPLLAPYVGPGRGKNAGVSEDEYGDYLLRYLCLALASGLVERVYWWRLVARGFGLVDDTDPAAWRPRPAYAMLQTFLGVLGESTFSGAQLPARSGKRHGRYRFAFRRPDGEMVALTYAHGPALPFPREESFARVEDAFGQALARTPDRLTGRPLYLRGSSGAPPPG